jgi:outer membrane protein assembly factor BamB
MGLRRLIPKNRRALVFVLPALALILSACDWTEFGYLASGGRSSADSGISLSNGASTLLDWSVTTGNVVWSSPAVANGVVYFGSGDGKVYALNATTGATVWTVTIGDSVESSPAVDNGLVYFGSNDGRFYALNATTGATVWTVNIGSAVLSSPAVANGVVYFGSGNGKVYALNATTGATVWTVTTGNNVFSSPAVANGVVYVGSYDDKVYALNATTGATVWTVTTGGSVHSSPAVANGVVYVGSDDGKVYALNATTGATVWSATTGGAVFSSPAVANGVFYLGSFDNKIYAYKPWAFSRPSCAVNSHPGMEPCQIQDAYRLPSAYAGSGKTVAVVDAYDDPNAETDLATYRSAYGLPACTTANGCFKKLNQSGVQGSYPAPAPSPAPGQGSWDLEMSLDLDAVSAACPLCHIVLVEANNPLNANLATAEDTAANQSGVVSISNSYGGSETNAYNAHYAHSGIVITASTGDSGYAGGPQSPATDPGVVAVGGTQLVQDSSARGWSETVWSGAGSGCSSIEPEPAWQSAIPVSWCSKRSIADVSALAGDPGLSMYDTFNGWGGWNAIFGTSVASPLIAAAYALAAPTQPVSYLYSHATSLNDITAGSNGSCGTGACTAETGYDGPTGLGTPCGTGAFGTGPWQTTSCPAGSNNAPSAPNVSTMRIVGCGPTQPGWAQCMLALVPKERSYAREIPSG